MAPERERINGGEPLVGDGRQSSLAQVWRQALELREAEKAGSRGAEEGVTQKKNSKMHTSPAELCCVLRHTCTG